MGRSLWLAGWIGATLSLPATAQEETTPAAGAAVERGLEMMARRQHRSGSYEGSAPVATSALCGLAFLASGSTYDRGPYSESIRRSVEYLSRCASKTGFLTEPYVSFGGGSGMHGHGYATLFLAEVLGTIGDADVQERVREILERAVRLIEGSQNRYGGWNSAPEPKHTDDGSGAVAVMQVTALRAARNAGIEVKERVVERAGEYILRITSDDGWTQYNIHSVSGGRGSSALTGAGMTILNALGDYDHPKLRKGVANVLAGAPFLHRESADGGWQTWYCYAAFYCTLAIFQTGGEAWRQWWPAMRDDLVKKQNSDGSWAGMYGNYGPLWSAFACLTLLMPYRYLPLFAEGGRGEEG
ncbi:MAG: terpene cyclase/mutase family protein, partial [Planctomycetes bacterium]|nr:terpene cyclase/mutase family protein [Planctomycetota bacterium]